MGSGRARAVRIGRKLFAVIAVFALLYAITAIPAIRNQKSAIRLASAEVEGLHFHAELNDYMTKIFEWRESSRAKGSTILPEVYAKQAAIQQKYESMREHLLEEPELRGLVSNFDQLHATFRALAQRAPQSVSVPFVVEKLCARYQALSIRVGEESRIILDGDTFVSSTYRIAGIATPRENATLAKVLRMNSAIINGQLKVPYFSEQSQSAFDQLDQVHASNKQLIRAMSLDGTNDELSQAIQSRFDNLQRSGVVLRTHLQRSVVAQRPESWRALVVTSAAESRMKQNLLLSGLIYEGLRNRIESKLTWLRFQHAMMLAFVAFIVMPALYFSYKLARDLAVMLSMVAHRLESLQRNDLAQLERAIAAMAAGETWMEVRTYAASARPLPVNSKDELGRLAKSLNEVASQILSTVQSFRKSRDSMSEARARIADSETRFRSVVEGLGEGIVMTDFEDTITYVNRRMCEMLGREPEELIGSKTYVLMFVDIDRNLAASNNDLRQRGISDTYETRLRRKDGSVLWCEVHATPFPDRAGNYVGTLGAVADIDDRKRFEEQLCHQAFHDALTGLPNRALFMERVERACSRAKNTSSQFALLFIDLDNFKVVNDSMGHKSGDILLQAVGEKITACVTELDTVARLGGDEFTILLEEVRTPDRPEQIANSILEVLNEPIIIEGRPVVIGASIGIAFGDDAVHDATELMRNADLAMYGAKAEGKRRHAVFTPAMTARAEERLDLENALRSAIPNNEFFLNYQPILSLRTHEVDEVEALIRWNHPQKGLVPPLKFVPIAEETGLIVELGRWVLRTACTEAVKLNREFQSNPITMSVNVSLPQFRNQELVANVREVLEETGLDPRYLKLEITESIMMDDPDHVVAVLRELRAMGVKIALDDFGTGYSSMSYLRSLPADTLKIDRTFVSRIGGAHEDEAILRAIVNVAKSLELTVTSEGIETLEQWSYLSSLGVEHGQGYLFSKPIPIKDLAAFIRQQSTSDDIRRAA